MDPVRDSPSFNFGERLAMERAGLMRFISNEGNALLKFEPIEDLVQGVLLRALSLQNQFEYRSDAEFVSWLHEVSRRHLSDRADYWTALRRRAGKVLRLAEGPGSESGGWSWLAASQSGPSTIAARREAVQIAMRILPALSERDQQLVRWSTEGLTLGEIAEKLHVNYEAANKSRQRALERFRNMFKVVVEGKIRPPEPT